MKNPKLAPATWNPGFTSLDLENKCVAYGCQRKALLTHIEALQKELKELKRRAGDENKKLKEALFDTRRSWRKALEGE